MNNEKLQELLKTSADALEKIAQESQQKDVIIQELEKGAAEKDAIIADYKRKDECFAITQELIRKKLVDPSDLSKYAEELYKQNKPLNIIREAADLVDAENGATIKFAYVDKSAIDGNNETPEQAFKRTMIEE